ncbi:hypothetical protein DY000_02053366 [Brassica cretica]|uniref:Uncharacterized protein n=1 Tax=Brassica cretica TaxID=69181 RepID=A0ABQ7AF39_BRACR|nr:hypothetical protein DY000_02053366 [Brassica cretica]
MMKFMNSRLTYMYQQIHRLKEKVDSLNEKIWNKWTVCRPTYRILALIRVTQTPETPLLMATSMDPVTFQRRRTLPNDANEARPSELTHHPGIPLSEIE